MDKWDKYAKAVHRIERQYAPQFERVVLDYRLSVIKAIKEQGAQATQGRIGSELVNVPIQPLLQEIYRKGGLMGARMTYREIKQSIRGKKSANNHLQIKAGGFGLNETWIADVLNFLKINLLNLASRITETMRQDVLAILTEGIENGWGISQMTDKLQDRVLIKSRARVIARTETVRAANVGHAIGAQSLPYEVDKVWIAAKDHRVRSSHKLVHEHKVDELGTFRVPIYRNGKPTGGFDLMQQPGDATATPGNTINCRCRIIHEAKTDANGKLIMRQGQPAPIVRMPDRNNVIELPQQQPLRAAFVPAASVAEAKQWAKDNLELRGDQREMPIEMMNLTNKRMFELKSEYVAPYLKSFDMDARGSAYASAGTFEMSFGKSWFNQPDKFKETLKKDVDNKWLHSGSDRIEAIIDHEFGHVLTSDAIANKYDIGPEITKLRAEYTKELKRLSKEGVDVKQTGVYISEYAQQSIHEFAAEAFSMSLNSRTPSPYAMRVKELIDKYYRKNDRATTNLPNVQAF